MPRWHLVVCSHAGELFDYEKEQGSPPCGSMPESCMWRKPDRKGHMLSEPIYRNAQNRPVCREESILARDGGSCLFIPVCGRRRQEESEPVLYTQKVLGRVAQTFNQCTWDAETGGYLR